MRIINFLLIIVNFQINFSSNYFSNGKVRITNINNIKILYIFFNSNSSLNFSIISQCNKVIYIVNIVCKIRFELFINIFIV